MTAIGRGSIEVLPSGRHAARMPDTTRLGTYDTREEAREMLDAAIAHLQSGRVEPKNVRSFKTAGQKWLDERELDGGRDVANDRSRWQHVERAPFYDLALKRIAPAMCFEWHLELRRAKITYPYDHPKNGERVSEQTAQRAYALASAFMQDACDRGWVPSNPFRAAGKPKKKATRTEEPFLELAEQGKLLNAAPEAERDIVDALLSTAWRTSEAAWMPLTDLHLDAVDADGKPTPYHYCRSLIPAREASWA